jgi:hypothetical protein
MICQLVDHPLTVDFVFRSMMQNVEPDKAGEQVVEFHEPNS